jgi:hypothetical protein
MDEKLLKSLNSAIDAAVKEMVSIDTLAKGDVSLQDAKLRSESTNGTLPGVSTEESTLKPEDANKADKEDSKEDKKEDEKKDDKKDEKKEDKKEDKDPFKDLDDDKVAKMKKAIEEFETSKKSAIAQPFGKAEIEQVTETLKKSVVSHVEELQKSFGERLTTLEGLIQKLVSTPQPRQSVSGLAPLAKSGEDVASSNTAVLEKVQVLDKLLTLQKSDDRRVDSTVIARVEMGDFSVLAERGINIK